jgi:hypothetical protein
MIGRRRAKVIQQHDRLASLLVELEQEKGPIDLQVLEDVRRAWPDPGEKVANRR